MTKIAIIGSGITGLAANYIASGVPGVETTIITRTIREPEDIQFCRLGAYRDAGVSGALSSMLADLDIDFEIVPFVTMVGDDCYESWTTRFDSVALCSELLDFAGPSSMLVADADELDLSGYDHVIDTRPHNKSETQIVTCEIGEFLRKNYLAQMLMCDRWEPEIGEIVDVQINTDGLARIRARGTHDINEFLDLSDTKIVASSSEVGPIYQTDRLSRFCERVVRIALIAAAKNEQSALMSEAP